MTDPTKCQRCGGQLDTEGALAALCPTCLMEQAMTQDLNKTVTMAGDPIADLAKVQSAFPHLEILEELGRGGMGVVYRARQPRLERTVAIKLVAPEREDDPSFLERFAREARAMAKLSHPNIVTVHDFGEVDGRGYLVMEYVEGCGMRDLMRRRPVDPEQALGLVGQICDGLEYAHRQGVVHRDIKPENILVDRNGQVKIADFGLARVTENGADAYTLTRSGQVVGTPAYMAPEQLRSSEVDHRADLYSLGVVFYELLTGALPIGRFDPPSSVSGVDGRLDRIVMRTLEQEPRRRYQHASEIKTDMSSVGDGPRDPAKSPKPLSSSNSTSSPTWPSRVPGGASLVAGLGIALAATWTFLMRATPTLAQEWYSFGYVCAAIALLIVRPGGSPTVTWGLRVIGFVNCVAILTLLCREPSHGGMTLWFEVAAMTVALIAQGVYHRWVRDGSPVLFVVAAAIFIVATVMHSSPAGIPGREAYYFASGITAVFSLSSVCVFLPELALSQYTRATGFALLRGSLVGIIAAGFYFHRYL